MYAISCDVGGDFEGLRMVGDDEGQLEICIFRAGQLISCVLLYFYTLCCNPNNDSYNLGGRFDNHPNS